MKQLVALALAVTTLAFITLDFADARGRTGSHRYGGYTSHGKGKGCLILSQRPARFKTLA
jgi:hypothetical protein